MITTDKVYKNNEWIFGYRENDPLGGQDPYMLAKQLQRLLLEVGDLVFVINHLLII